MKNTTKKILSLSMIYLLNIQSIYALNLIDNTENIYKEITKSNVVTLKDGIELTYKTNPIGEISSYKGYILKDNYKYLINNDIIHEFNENNEYVKTIKYTISDEKINMEFKYVKSLEQEYYEYKKAGFTNLPTIHFSIVPQKVKYYNQLNNSLYPNTSCTPTSVSIYMNLLGLEDIAPDTISKDIPKLYNGSYVSDSLDWLEDNGMYTTHYTYLDNEDKNKWIELLHKGKPIIASIKSSFIRYPSPNEMVNNRLYRVSNYEDGEYYHTIVITGYLVVDGVTYIEVFDPWSKGYVSTTNGTIPDGKGKYMTLDEFNRVYDNGLKAIDFTKIEKEETIDMIEILEIKELDNKKTP